MEDEKLNRAKAVIKKALELADMCEGFECRGTFNDDCKCRSCDVIREMDDIVREEKD